MCFYFIVLFVSFWFYLGIVSPAQVAVLCFCLFLLLPGLRWIIALFRFTISCICTSVKYDPFSFWWFFFVAYYLVQPVLFQVTTVEWRIHTSSHMFFIWFSRIRHSVLFCVVLFFPVLFMRHLLHVSSVCPRGRIPPLWFSVESHVWGQRTSLTVQIVKPAEGMWPWFWAIWIKRIWFIPWSDDVWCVQMFCDTRWWWVHWHCFYFVLVSHDNRRAIHKIYSYWKILWDCWTKVISIWWNHDVPLLKMSQGCSPDCLLSDILEFWGFFCKYIQFNFCCTSMHMHIQYAPISHLAPHKHWVMYIKSVSVDLLLIQPQKNTLNAVVPSN